jgi:hypothetical protein
VQRRRARLLLQALGGGGRLFDQRGVLLRHLVELRDGLVDLADAALCSPAAAEISPMMSLTRCTLATISSMVPPASRTRRVPVSTRSTLAPISDLISRAASAERCARLRTSPATTAKPRPCSPARAASTAALSARMLVWKAMPSMVPMMSAIAASWR